MSVHKRVSGTWREVEAPSVRVSGTWRDVDEQFVRVEGTWRTVFKFIDPADPDNIGASYEGGYIGGTITDCDGEDWAIIVSPEALGDPGDNMQWKTTNTTTSGPTDSLCDGPGNTTTICADIGTHPAGDWVCSLNDGSGTNGYTDWYLPSIDELVIMYQNMYQGSRNTTLPVGTDWRDDGEGFQPMYYWSSSQEGYSYSWGVPFHYGGYMYNLLKTHTHRVRAVRRILL